MVQRQGCSVGPNRRKREGDKEEGEHHSSRIGRRGTAGALTRSLAVQGVRLSSWKAQADGRRQCRWCLRISACKREERGKGQSVVAAAGKERQIWSRGAQDRLWEGHREFTHPDAAAPGAGCGGGARSVDEARRQAAGRISGAALRYAAANTNSHGTTARVRCKPNFKAWMASWPEQHLPISPPPELNGASYHHY